MSWLTRRAPNDADETATIAFAGTFALAVDRTFPSDDDAIKRVRDRVLAAFSEDAPTVSTRVSVSTRVPVSTRLHRPVRRGLTIALAVALTLLAFGSVAVQAQPGGPFYALKLAIETATLPAVEAPSGWEARLERLQRRIDEGLLARRSANEAAVTSALGEYRSELAELDDVLVDPARRSSLIAVVSDDVPIVVDLETTYPSETARLLLAEMRAIVGPTEQVGRDAKPVGVPIEDQPDDATDDVKRGFGDPHADGAAGNGAGDPHADGAKGNPHADGTKGNPHPDGATGNPHADGTKGNPHPDGATGKPHKDGVSGDPHGSSARDSKDRKSKTKD